MRWLTLGFAAILWPACAAIPQPDVLSNVDRARESSSVQAAKRDAPTAFAAAEKLRTQAHAAFEEEDAAGAQILGERALAAYEEAVALARVVRADKQRQGVAAEVKKHEARLAELDNQHQQLAADIAALEGKVKVLRQLEPVSPSGPAGPAREKARWQAVASIHLGAQLLCSAATLLDAARRKEAGYKAPSQLAAATKGLESLRLTIEGKPDTAPIDPAMRARAACLDALTRVRRGNTDAKRSAGRADALLEALSNLGEGTPSRDDRGVVVTLRSAFEDDGLSASGKRAVAEIAKVAASHKQFPVMVVVHGDASSASRGRAIVDALRGDLGRERVADAHLAGDAAPVVDPKGPTAQRNTRIDVVFVSPEAL